MEHTRTFIPGFVWVAISDIIFPRFVSIKEEGRPPSQKIHHIRINREECKFNPIFFFKFLFCTVDNICQLRLDFVTMIQGYGTSTTAFLGCCGSGIVIIWFRAMVPLPQPSWAAVDQVLLPYDLGLYCSTSTTAFLGCCGSGMIQGYGSSTTAFLGCCGSGIVTIWFRAMVPLPQPSWAVVDQVLLSYDLELWYLYHSLPRLLWNVDQVWIIKKGKFEFHSNVPEQFHVF